MSSKYVHIHESGANSDKHVIIEGTAGDYDVSVLNGTLGQCGTVAMSYTVDTFRQAKKLAIGLVEAFNLQGWEDVAHDPINA
jgi:hypothetical protein